MSNIERYSEYKYEAGLYNDNVDGDWCKYADVDSIIKRNAELEAEIARLRKDVALPDALIKWANLPDVEPELTSESTKGEWRSDGYQAARRWVKMQLDLMKGDA